MHHKSGIMILQGTTAMLISFGASQVKYHYLNNKFLKNIYFRKICRDCKKVLDYLAISEVIETMEDLVQFVKDLRKISFLEHI